ncbi:MAG: glutamate 5-kinase [Trueperaceae bacterium]|jgi:glutamate 5-kinase|nr:glutamate 5-kinase [Truepera sp.]HRN17475.1 glutamate 5-kinase [Trueperaceae bacterium]HRQ11198.1 glutamate 5-kinase [Trueperaceae bacterium]
MSRVQGRWRRIVIKVGTSSLVDESGRIAPYKMWDVARGAQVLAAAQKGSAQFVIVSSGAGAAGRQRLGLKLPLTLPDKQAAAAVGQALLMLDWERALSPRPTAQLLISASDVQERERYVNAKSALEATLALGVVPVINENDSVATAELKLGDNDTLSAWVSYLVDADVLIILTDVDGLYDSDPKRNPDAKRIEVVSDIGEVTQLAGRPGSALGTGGMATKLRAARIATGAGIETIVLGGGGAALEALARGERRGTRFLAPVHVPARKAWIANQPVRGALLVDAGAARALAAGKSLLPGGVTGVTGVFTFGDAVEIRHEGTRIGVGLTNYGSEAVERIRGRHSQAIAELLGHKDYDEVIHRDNFMLTSAAAQAQGTPPAPR